MLILHRVDLLSKSTNSEDRNMSNYGTTESTIMQITWYKDGMPMGNYRANAIVIGEFIAQQTEFFDAKYVFQSRQGDEARFDLRNEGGYVFYTLYMRPIPLDEGV